MAPLGKWGAGGDLCRQLRALSQVASVLEGNNQSSKSQGWLCQRANCHYAKQGFKNWPDRRWCAGCQRPKDEAMNPNAKKQDSVNDKDTYKDKSEVTGKGKKKREARARKREAKAAAKADAASKGKPGTTVDQTSNPGPVAQAMSKSEDVTTSNKVTLPDALLDAIPLLLPHAANGIIQSLAKEHAPGPVDTRTPEEILSKLLGGRGAVARVAKRDELEDDIKKLNSGIAALASGGDAVTEAVATLTKQREAAETALQKLNKDTPSQDHEYRAVQEAKSSFELTIQARKDRESRGQTNAQGRHALRKVLIQDLKDQIALLEAGVAEAESKNNTVHTKRVADMANLDMKVLELFDRKLQSLQTTRQAPLPETAPQARQALPGPAPQPTHVTELENARKQIAALQAKLEQGIAKILSDFECSFEVSQDQLPKVTIPEAAHLPAVAALYETMASWSLAGASMPFDWVAIDPVVGDALDIITITKELLGALWAKWYDAGDPEKTAVVPRQVALLLLHCLSSIKSEFESIDQTASNKTAMESMGRMQETAKRLRVA